MRAVLRSLDETLKEGDEGYLSKNITLFKKKHRYGFIKDISLKCTQNIVLEIYKEDESGLQPIKTVKLLNVTDYKKN